MKVFGFTVLNPSSHIDPSQLFSGGSPWSWREARKCLCFREKNRATSPCEMVPGKQWKGSCRSVNWSSKKCGNCYLGTYTPSLVWEDRCSHFCQAHLILPTLAHIHLLTGRYLTFIHLVLAHCLAYCPHLSHAGTHMLTGTTSYWHMLTSLRHPHSPTRKCKHSNISTRILFLKHICLFLRYKCGHASAKIYFLQ